MRKDEIQVLVKKLIDRFSGKEEADPSLLSRLHQIEERAEISGKHRAVEQTKGSGEISGKFGAVKGSNTPDADSSAMAHWSSTPDKFMRQRMREIEQLAGGHKGFEIDPYEETVGEGTSATQYMQLCGGAYSTKVPEFRHLFSTK